MRPTSIPCFKGPAEGEVVVSGRKLIGSAMRERSGSILQHGAILLGWDGRLQAGSMGLDDDGTLRRHVSTLRDELDQDIPRAVLEETLVEAFTKELGVRFEEGQPSDAERAREQELISSFSVDG